jgi:hypothetical protein
MDKQELIQLDTKALALRATNRYKLRLNERISPSIEFPSYAHEFSFENGMMLIHVNEDGVWVPDYDWNNQLGNRTATTLTFRVREKSVYFFQVANIPNFIKSANEEYLELIIKPYEGEDSDD